MKGLWRYYLGNLQKICNSIYSKRKKTVNKLICSQYLDSQFLCIHFFLSFWTNNATNVLKVMKLVYLLTCHLTFSIFILEILNFEIVWTFEIVNEIFSLNAKTLSTFQVLLILVHYDWLIPHPEGLLVITILLALQVDIDLNYDTIVPIISPVVLEVLCSHFDIVAVMLQYAQVWFNSTYWLHCQSFLLGFKSF